MSPIVSHGDPLFPASYLILLLLLSFSQNEKAGWEQNNQGMLCPARGKVGQMTNSFIPQILYLEAFPHHPGASIRGHQVARYPSGKGMPSTQRQQCGFHNHSYPFLRRVPMKSSRLPSPECPAFSVLRIPVSPSVPYVSKTQVRGTVGFGDILSALCAEKGEAFSLPPPPSITQWVSPKEYAAT